MMDGTALIYAEGALGTPQARTANNLLRYGRRYEIVGVIDSRYAGRRASEVVEGVAHDAPVFTDFAQALAMLEEKPRYLVIGLTPDDSRREPCVRRVILEAVRHGVSVDCALKPYLHDDAELPQLAMSSPARLRSVGYPVPLARLRPYSGRIAEVSALKITVTGTTAPVGGKNVTAVRLTEALNNRSIRSEMIGTSEAAWFQGVRHAVILDSILHPYIAGEIEAVICEAAETSCPQVMVLEGSGSILDPAHPTGLELLTTARPDAVILQHAPFHSSFMPSDVFGTKSLERHLKAIEAIAERRVLAIAVSHTNDAQQAFGGELKEATTALHTRFGLPVVDVLIDGCDPLADLVEARLQVAANVCA